MKKRSRSNGSGCHPIASNGHSQHPTAEFRLIVPILLSCEDEVRVGNLIHKSSPILTNLIRAKTTNDIAPKRRIKSRQNAEQVVFCFEK
jgi:hypothetical protein